MPPTATLETDLLFARITHQINLDAYVAALDASIGPDGEIGLGWDEVCAMGDRVARLAGNVDRLERQIARRTPSGYRGNSAWAGL